MTTLNVEFPFKNTILTGVFSTTNRTIDMYKSDLYSLLLTKRGERMMIPTFGSPIYEFMFENLSDDIIGLLETEIRQVVALWIPEILIKEVSVTNDGANTFSIVIHFSLQQDVEEMEQIKIEVNL